MRVCFAAPQVIRMIQGGLRTQIGETARYLRELGVEVEFFDQWREFRREEYDLFHIFRASTATFELASYLANLGVPYVVSPVLYTRRSFGFVRSILKAEDMVRRIYSGFMSEWGMSRAICTKAGAVLPNTTHEAEFFITGMGIPRSNVTVIPNGVDSRFADADPSLFITTYGMKDFILYVGNIGAERKNALGFIRAMASTGYSAVLVGPVYDNAYARQCIEEAHRSGNIHIIGALPNDSPMLASAYAACRVFVLPSYFETPGIAALEAGLAGAPVVITRHGGTTDYFASFARYVDPTSTTDIVQAVRDALQEPRSETLRDHIRRNFLWQSVAAQTAEMYRKIGLPAAG